MVINAKEKVKQEKKTRTVGVLYLLGILQTPFDNSIKKYLFRFYFFKKKKYDPKSGGGGTHI